MTEFERMNAIVEKTVNLFFCQGPDFDEQEGGIGQWVASLTLRDAELLLSWVEQHSADSSMFQVSPDWDSTTCRTVLECVALVGSRESSDHLRHRLESLLSNIELRQHVVFALSKIAQEKSLPAVRKILHDDRYEIVDEVGSLLAIIKTAESVRLLDELIIRYRSWPKHRSTLESSRNELDL